MDLEAVEQFVDVILSRPSELFSSREKDAIYRASRSCPVALRLRLIDAIRKAFLDQHFSAEDGMPFGNLQELHIEELYQTLAHDSVRKGSAVAQFVLDLTRDSNNARFSPSELLVRSRPGYEELFARCKELVGNLPHADQIPFIDFASEEVRNSYFTAFDYLVETIRFTRSTFNIVHEIDTFGLPQSHPLSSGPSSSSSSSSPDAPSSSSVDGEGASRRISSNKQKVSIMLVGAAGAGKSTLTNEIFGSKLERKAKEGTGSASVTEDVKRYTATKYRPPAPEEIELGADPDRDLEITLEVIDTPGTVKAEKDKQKEVEELAEKLLSQVIEGIVDPRKRIDIVIYVVNGNDPRLQLFDIFFVKQISNYVPVCLTMTQSTFPESVDKVLSQLQNEYDFDPEWIFKVHARKRSAFFGEIPAFGMADLGKGLGRMYNEVDLSDKIGKSFIKGFEDDLQERKKKAYAIVRNYALLASAVGATPIPFVDSVGLILLQTTMIARINMMYGVTLSRNLITTLISAVITAPNAFSVIGVTSLVLSYGVDDMLKLIPGLNIVGSIVGAGVAASFTTFLGFVVVKSLEKLISKYPHYRSLTPAEIQEILVAEASNAAKDDKIKQSIENEVNAST